MRIKIPKISASTILSWISVGGTIATAVMTGLATKKLIDKTIEEGKQKPETIFVIYLPAIGVCVGTVICTLGANALNKKQQASMISVYGMLSQKFSKYRGKLIELHGEEEDQEITDAIVRENPEITDAIVRENPEYHLVDCNIPERKLIWIEGVTGERFERYEREIIDAEYHFNRNYSLGGTATFNEWRMFLGLEPVKGGDKKGWSVSSGIYWIDFEHLIEKQKDGSYIYTVMPVFDPDEDFEED